VFYLSLFKKNFSSVLEVVIFGSNIRLWRWPSINYFYQWHTHTHKSINDFLSAGPSVRWVPSVCKRNDQIEIAMCYHSDCACYHVHLTYCIFSHSLSEFHRVMEESDVVSWWMNFDRTDWQFMCVNHHHLCNARSQTIWWYDNFTWKISEVENFWHLFMIVKYLDHILF